MNTKTANPTPGPWTIRPRSMTEADRIAAGEDAMSVARTSTEDFLGWELDGPEPVGRGDFIGPDAALIAEAGTVYHETGLTPRQLADQSAELIAALESFVDACEKSPPIHLLNYINKACVGAKAALACAKVVPK